MVAQGDQPAAITDHAAAPALRPIRRLLILDCPESSHRVHLRPSSNRLASLPAFGAVSVVHAGVTRAGGLEDSVVLLTVAKSR
jgi:hypothetical protein